MGLERLWLHPGLCFDVYQGSIFYIKYVTVKINTYCSVEVHSDGIEKAFHTVNQILSAHFNLH